jgi:hypothetical protein
MKSTKSAIRYAKALLEMAVEKLGLIIFSKRLIAVTGNYTQQMVKEW